MNFFNFLISKNRIEKALLCILVLSSIVGTAMGTASAQNNILFLPDTSVIVGEESNVPLALLNSTGVGGAQLAIYFDPTVINITDATAGDFNSIFNVDYSNVTDGILRITCMKLGQDLVGDLIIANLTINALAEGISPLNIAPVEGSGGVLLTTSIGTSVDAVINNGSVTVLLGEDTTPPVLTFVDPTPADNTVIKEKSFTFQVNVTSNELLKNATLFMEVYYPNGTLIDTYLMPMNKTGTTTWNASIVFKDAKPFILKYKVVGYDLAGNMGETEKRTLNVMVLPDLIGILHVPEFIKKYKANDTYGYDFVIVSAAFEIRNIGFANVTYDPSNPIKIAATYKSTSYSYELDQDQIDDLNEDGVLYINDSVVVDATSINLGGYTFNLTVDSTNVVEELNETNNNVTATVYIARPDLVPILGVPPAELPPGAYNLTVGVINIGPVFAIPTQLKLEIEKDGILNSQVFNIPSLEEFDGAFGGNDTWFTNISVNFANEGVYNITVYANFNNIEAESVYINNTVTRQVVIVNIPEVNVTIQSFYNVLKGETRTLHIFLEDISGNYPVKSFSLVFTYDPRVMKVIGSNTTLDNVTIYPPYKKYYTLEEVKINGNNLNLTGTVEIANLTLLSVNDRGWESPLDLKGKLWTVIEWTGTPVEIPMNVTKGTFSTIKVTDLRPYVWTYPKMIAGDNSSIRVIVRNLMYNPTDNYTLVVSVFNATNGNLVDELLNDTFPGISWYGWELFWVYWTPNEPGKYFINVTLYNDTIVENNNASILVKVEQYKLDAWRIWYPWWEVKRGNEFYVGGYYKATHPSWVNATIQLPPGLELVPGQTPNKTVHAWASHWNSVWWKVKATAAGLYGAGTTNVIEISVEAKGVNDTVTTDESPTWPLKIVVPTIWVYSTNSTVLKDNITSTTFKTINITTLEQKMKIVVQAGSDGRRLSGLDYLVRYPYGCVEQITSRMLGALHTDEYYRSRPEGYPAGYNWDKVNDSILAGVQKLAKGGVRGQHDNGSWSMWGHRPRGDGFYTMYASYGLGRVATDEIYGHLVTDNITDKHTAVEAPGKFNFNDTIFWFNQTAKEDPSGAIYWTPWQGTHWFFQGHLPVTAWTMVSHYHMVNYERVNDTAKDIANGTMKRVTKYLVETQRDDGGWNQWGTDSASQPSDAISTAFAVWGLKLYGMEGYVNKTQIENAIEKGMAWLINNQQAEGYWQHPLASPWWDNYGRKSEATAYALIALNETASMGGLNFTSLNNTNGTIMKGVSYLIQTYRHHGSWGYTASTQAALHALTILQALVTSNTTMEITIDGVVTKTVSVDETTPMLVIHLNTTEIDLINNAGTIDGKKKIHTVTVNRTSGSGLAIVSVENDQLVAIDELLPGDVDGHKITSTGQIVRTVLTSLDDGDQRILQDGAGDEISVTPQLPDDLVEGQMYTLTVTIQNDNNTALLSPIVTVPLGKLNFEDVKPYNVTYALISGSKIEIDHEYDAANNTLLLFPDEIPPADSIKVYFNATLNAGDVTFEARVTPMYNELLTFIGNTTGYVKGYGNITVNAFNATGASLDATVTIKGEVKSANTKIKALEGTYTIEVTKEGYVPVRTTVTVNPGEELNFTVELYKPDELTEPKVLFVEGDLNTLKSKASLLNNVTVKPNAETKAKREFTVSTSGDGKAIIAVKIPEYKRGNLSVPLNDTITITNVTYSIEGDIVYIEATGSVTIDLAFEGRMLGDTTSIGDGTKRYNPNTGKLEAVNVTPDDALAILQYFLFKKTAHSTDLWDRYLVYGDTTSIGDGTKRYNPNTGKLEAVNVTPDDALAILQYFLFKKTAHSTDLWGE